MIQKISTIFCNMYLSKWTRLTNTAENVINLVPKSVGSIKAKATNRLEVNALKYTVVRQWTQLNSLLSP